MTADVQPLLWVPDFDRALSFYRDGLGFEVRFTGMNPTTGDPGTAGVEYHGAVVILSALDQFAPDGGHAPGGVSLYFHVDEDLDALFARWKEAPGGQVVAAPADQWWADRIFVLADPFGYRLVASRPIGAAGA